MSADADTSIGERQPGAQPPASASPPGAPRAHALDEPSGDPDVDGMEHRRERIRVETERCRIVGYVTLARDGYRSRVSDVLNAPERDFLTLTEATIEPLDGGPVELHEFMMVARRHIVFAVAAPEE